MMSLKSTRGRSLSLWLFSSYSVPPTTVRPSPALHCHSPALLPILLQPPASRLSPHSESSCQCLPMCSPVPAPSQAHTSRPLPAFPQPPGHL
ncbi:hypothetical protein E2C01_013369 [Portunus trituberculatus]|uniref:Uncharacterized protein n=1 Tax=Portunus trituberculatus TaxID=210409 RepID=A0A5B7DGX2_PORTR|nr:hypothetical protein [Portunus trituberculatus]